MLIYKGQVIHNLEKGITYGVIKNGENINNNKQAISEKKIARFKMLYCLWADIIIIKDGV